MGKAKGRVKKPEPFLFQVPHIRYQVPNNVWMHFVAGPKKTKSAQTACGHSPSLIPAKAPSPSTTDKPMDTFFLCIARTSRRGGIYCRAKWHRLQQPSLTRACNRSQIQEACTTLAGKPVGPELQDLQGLQSSKPGRNRTCVLQDKINIHIYIHIYC